jgi:uncharacterized protein YcbK (DUF882 family)
VRWFAPTKPPSPHFSWAEVIGNGRSGYSRVPLGPTPIGLGRMVLTPRRNAKRHAQQLEQVRAQVNASRQHKGFRPTVLHILSWARSFEHNRQIGGARDSQHLYFLATDISVQEIDRLMPWDGGRRDFDAILEAVFANGGIGEYPAGNRHVDSRGHPARWTVA